MRSFPSFRGHALAAGAVALGYRCTKEVGRINHLAIPNAQLVTGFSIRNLRRSGLHPLPVSFGFSLDRSARVPSGSVLSFPVSPALSRPAGHPGRAG